MSKRKPRMFFIFGGYFNFSKNHNELSKVAQMANKSPYLVNLSQAGLSCLVQCLLVRPRAYPRVEEVLHSGRLRLTRKHYTKFKRPARV